MVQTHLTAEDMEKYLDTSDLSEEYLLWMESVSEHLSGCTKCQEALNRAMETDSICDEKELGDALELASHEEEIRRSILLCKLQQMQEQERVADVIRLLKENAVTSYVLQTGDLQRKAGVARGEKNPTVSKGVEFSCENDKLIVKVSDKNSSQQVTVLLEQKNVEPVVREALWDEAAGLWMASFEVVNSDLEFEIYIL